MTKIKTCAALSPQTSSPKATGIKNPYDVDGFSFRNSVSLVPVSVFLYSDKRCLHSQIEIQKQVEKFLSTQNRVVFFLQSLVLLAVLV